MGEQEESRNEQSSEHGQKSSSSSENLKTLKWINLFAYTVNIIVTYGIGVTGLFNLPTNGELSEEYQTLVTPIGWAFSIWGIIFIAQAIWVLQQFFCVSESTAVSVKTIKYNYVYVVLAQASWTLSFSFEVIELSFVMMTLILSTLFVIGRKLSKLELSKLEMTEPDNSACIKAKDYFLLQFPFRIHFGWILAATVVNANVVLVNFDLSSNILFAGAVAGLVFIAVTAIWMVLAGYVTVPVIEAWALFGVFSELRSPKDSIATAFSFQQIESIQYSAIGVMALILVAVGLSCARKIWLARRS